MEPHELEDSIVAQLHSLSDAGCKVIVLPETQGQQEPMAFTKSRVVVGYLESEFADPQSTSQISQYEKISFTVTIESRKLRGEWGVYDMRKKISSLLVGYEPEDCDRVFLKKFDFVDYEGGVWTYAFTMQCVTLIVENTDAVNLGNIQQITVNPNL